jgi:glycolate oxidase
VSSGENSKDKWFASHRPDAVVLPGSTESVSKLLQWAERHEVPVTARGAGHGYVGGCVPVRGGVVLSLARMNKIKEINPADFVAVVEPGVNTQHLADEVEKQKLFYPPDPASKKDNAIGGNISTNAGGPRCLKYGVTRDYVLGLEVGPGWRQSSAIRGTHAQKQNGDSTYIDSSWGLKACWGVITEATLKLLPLPPYRACLAIGFDSMRRAVGSLNAILQAGFLPAALEIADAFTLAAARKRTGSKRLEGCRAHLIVELDGQARSVRG